MKTLSEVNIRNLFPAHIYNRGLDYYNRDRVKNLIYDRNNQVWTALVQGTDDYFVELDMRGLSKGIIDTECDCPAFAAYGSCKHIAASLIAVSHQQTEQEQSSAPSTYDYETTKHFINAMSALNQQTSNPEFIIRKSPLYIEYYCKWSYDKKLLIELKAGVKRCFVVRDAEEFIENVLNGNEHFFTKNFTFSPEHHFVSQHDMAIFKMLYTIIRNEEIYEGYTFYPQRKNAKERRFIVVPPLMVEELLEKLVQRDFTVESDQRTYSNPQLVKDTLPFTFNLKETAHSDLMLTIGDMNDAVYFDLYELFFHDGIFYYPGKEQVPVLELIDRLGMGSQQLPIEKNQADTFLSDVLPSLEKVGQINIDAGVESKIVHHPLRAKMYLSMKEDFIVGQLQYHYGSEQIDPFSGRHQSEYLISRDSEKERQIMGLIEHANFHYNGEELYIPSDDDTLYDFVYHVIPLLDKYVELFLTSDIQHLIIDHEPEASANVEVESSTNLLEIGFDIEGIDEDEVSRILDAVIERKKYYRLQNGALLSLENDEFTSIQQLLDNLDVGKEDIQDGHIHMPVYRSTQVDELIQTRKNYDVSFEKLLQQLRSPEKQDYELPKNLQATLRSYQVTGYQWFKSLSHYHLGGILADDMGLGKTLQTIAYILSEPSELPHLIVVPSSVVYNWKNECAKFAPDLQVEIMAGTPAERAEKIKLSGDQDIWITSYATLRQDIEHYRQLNFQTMILDEAQYIKNYATKTSKAVREIKASRRFALSGTPIENSIEELWAIFQVVLPGLMPSQRRFKQLSHDRIASITKPFILRRLKQDVLTELPDKIESVYVSELTKQQKDLYVGYLSQLRKQADESIKQSGFDQSRMKILAGITRLRQLCCHPSLFIENYPGQSGKLEQLMETVKQTHVNGGRMLIFSQFTSMHEIMKEKLEAEGFSCFYLHGGTPAKERVEMSERFNNGEKDIFLISLKAGGTGLNLTGADTVILYDLWWNPAVEDQATGRAHRFGQKNVVQVIRLITEGTIEEKIYDLQQKKRELIDQVIQPGETMLSSLSEEDVRELLSI